MEAHTAEDIIWMLCAVAMVGGALFIGRRFRDSLGISHSVQVSLENPTSCCCSKAGFETSTCAGQEILREILDWYRVS